MILFCDTSALIKLYIDEDGSSELKIRLQESEAVAVCRIAWAEAYAALSRRARELPADVDNIEQAKVALAADWPHFVVLEIDQPLVERAGEYADTFALRGYDSIQLAAAFEAGSVSQTPIFFACFDSRLNKAAKLLGMSCL
ncbi:MAG: type II toxin-antitoxin system VapC family toxin [Methylophilaceae bacterium]|nr:MAG: type II toxin-antitoxin system VapC family toxin [Methylophilaceae bacterium]